MSEPESITSRLVVELNRRPSADLAWTTKYKELNKTTIVNRAIQVYKLIVELQSRNGYIVLHDPDKKNPESLRIV